MGMEDTKIAVENNEHAICLIDDYFSDKVRYRYYIITRYIADYIINAKDPETVEYIMYRLEQIMEYMKLKWEEAAKELCDCALERCINLDTSYANDEICLVSIDDIKIADRSYKCHKFKQLYRRIVKLYDHIKLEYIRLSSINDQYKKTLKLQDELENRLNENLEKEKHISKTMDRLSNKEKDLYLQVVAILGIFTSIVVAVFGVIGIVSNSQELYKAIENYGIEAAIFSFLMTAFILYNIVLIIVQCIKSRYIEINNYDKNEKGVLSVVIVNIVFGVCIIACMLKLLF